MDSCEQETRQAAPHSESAEDVVRALGTDATFGLSDSEAARRLAHYGCNELTAKESESPWRRFLAQFRNVLIALLLVAAAFSAGLWLIERETALPFDAMAIFAVVLLNAIMGYLQESRAESAVTALRRMAAANACVVRDGERSEVLAADVVPGDLILVDAGDAVPADARLVHSIALQTMEATLTGESLPVSKDADPVTEKASLGDQCNMIFCGTTVTCGRGKGVVTATGMQTEMGRIAGMLEEAYDETTPLERELDQLGKRLGLVVIIIAFAMIATIMLVENIRGLPALLDVLILGVALAVAAVPEGLLAVVTAVLALGVQRMAKRNAIVRHLAAVETLGSANVIASDKTGTLTRNEMTVRIVATASGRVDFSGTGYAPDGKVRVEGGGPIEGTLRAELSRAITVAERANNAKLLQRNGHWSIQGDPTEGALVVAARKSGLKEETLNARFERIGEVPFSSERKLMTTIHSDAEREKRVLVFTKGAPDVLISRCSRELLGEESRLLSDARRAELLKANEELAGLAMRTLGVAVRDLPAEAFRCEDANERIEQDLIFIGLIGMIDPPREEAKQAVARARIAGIRPIMITGDHPKTAAVIAAELGIATDGRTVTGAELENMSDEALAQTVANTSVYARVDPRHKLRLVKALQSGGATVAMTGDGVNDAPALEAADIGIAMGITGTDVSKQAADVVLTDDNFATIVSAVEEGRAIFDNIRKFLRYLLSSNIGEVMTMFLGVLLAKVIGLRGEEDAHAVGNPTLLPLLATQILWINLVTDGAPAMALGVDPTDADVMNLPPRPRGKGVLTRRMWTGIFFIGAVMAVGTLLVLDACLPGGMIAGSGDIRFARTMAFTTLMMFQLFNVFNARSDEQSAFKGVFRNRWLWGAVGVSLALHIIVIYAPFLQSAFSTVSLRLGDWLLCTAVASSVLWLRETTKWITRMARRRVALSLN